MMGLINSINLRRLLLSALLVTAISFPALAYSSSVVAQDNKGELCSGANLDLSKSKSSCRSSDGKPLNKGGELCKDAQGRNVDCGDDRLNSLIAQIVNILSIIVGVVAVIMMIYGGFRYITSGGDSGKVGEAKQTIIYAIVGLIIVALAQLIVKFVLEKAT